MDRPGSSRGLLNPKPPALPDSYLCSHLSLLSSLHTSQQPIWDRAKQMGTRGIVWNANADCVVWWVGGLGLWVISTRLNESALPTYSPYLCSEGLGIPLGTCPEPQHSVISQAEHTGQQRAKPGAIWG